MNSSRIEDGVLMRDDIAFRLLRVSSQVVVSVLCCAELCSAVPSFRCGGGSDVSAYSGNTNDVCC